MYKTPYLDTNQQLESTSLSNISNGEMSFLNFKSGMQLEFIHFGPLPKIITNSWILSSLFTT